MLRLDLTLIIYFIMSSINCFNISFEESVQKIIVFDTKPLNLILRGFSWIFKSINLCYNQCIINIKNHEFLDDERRVYLHRELDFISKYS